MAAELLTGLSVFKTMLDMAKALKDINDRTIRNAAVIELQEKIFTAREQQSALAERVRDLEKEVTDFKAWGTEKQRYELVELYGGSLAYTVKETMRGTEPTHYICASCYQKGQKSLMQGVESSLGERQLRCPECKLEITHSFDPDWKPHF